MASGVSRIFAAECVARGLINTEMDPHTGADNGHVSRIRGEELEATGCLGMWLEKWQWLRLQEFEMTD